MKILEPPPPAAEWKSNLLCTSCGALLEVEPGDLQRDASSIHPFWVTCPCCQAGVRLTCGIPKDVQDVVNKTLQG
jgi:hypothetical protein